MPLEREGIDIFLVFVWVLCGCTSVLILDSIFSFQSFAILLFLKSDFIFKIKMVYLKARFLT